jgi:phosphatidyl-myo-inositol dimannoside synthase
MNILLISEIYPPKVGGSGRWFWEIYSRLHSDHCIVAAGCDPFAEVFDATHSLQCERWPFTLGSWGITSFSSIKEYFVLFLLVRVAVKTHRVNAIHCGRGLPEGFLGWLAWKWFGIPYLCYVHGEELPTYHSSREYKFLSQLVYTSAKQIIVNSANTQRSFIAHTGIEETVCIMNPGVDTTYFTPMEKNEELRFNLGWSGRKVVLTVGRLQKRKGHDHVILAMNRIREQVPNVLYAIAGDGEERTFLEDLVAAEKLQDYVQFLGKVDEVTMLTCYQQSDLFVLANREVDSDFEGFGMVLVEAQACGKPVIAGKSGGTAETMIIGKTGLLVEADNPESIADGIVQLIMDDQKLMRMGLCAIEWVRSKFDWPVLVAEAEKIFSELSLRR